MLDTGKVYAYCRMRESVIEEERDLAAVEARRTILLKPVAGVRTRGQVEVVSFASLSQIHRTPGRASQELE